MIEVGTVSANVIRAARRRARLLYRVRRGLIYVHRQETLRPVDVTCPSSALVETAGAEAFEIAAWNGLDLREVRRRLESGERCFALKSSQQNVAACWLHQGPCYVRGADIWIESMPVTYYCYGVITKPGERGRGYYRKLLEELQQRAQIEGIRTIIQYVESANVVPQMVLPKYGYTPTPVISRRFGQFRRTACFDEHSGEFSNIWLSSDPGGVYIV